MPVFDKTTKVARKVADPTTDKKLPDPKSLSYNQEAIATPYALSGTAGRDCKLINNGDRYQVIHGSMTETIDQDQTTTINGSETHSVKVNETFTVNGDRTDTSYGKFTLTVYDSTLCTYHSDVKILYLSTLDQNKFGQETTEHSDTHWESKTTDMGSFDFRFEVGPLAIGFIAAELGAKLWDIGLIGQIELGVKNTAIDLLAYDVGFRIYKTENEGIKLFMEGAEAGHTMKVNAGASKHI